MLISRKDNVSVVIPEMKIVIFLKFEFQHPVHKNI